MKKNELRVWITSAAFLLLFLILTLCVCFVDVQPIGPESSQVGLSAVNGAVFDTLGVSETWETVTELIGLVAIGCAVLFALLGFVQLIKRRSLKEVDRDLYALALLYVAVGICYMVFEVLVINYRPILVDGVLEASYPSSHTMLVLCLLGAAMHQLWQRVPCRAWRTVGAALISILMMLTAIGRLLAGVHWLTDVLGSILLSASLVCAYLALCMHVKHKA